MSSTETGKLAERAAGKHLTSTGYEVIAYNWRTRYCEIDIVAQKDQTVFFVEVKYRASRRQGGGLEYVTTRKQEQMAFAAEVWVSQHDWPGEYCLAAIEVDGPDYVVGNLVTEL